MCTDDIAHKQKTMNSWKSWISNGTSFFFGTPEWEKYLPSTFYHVIVCNKHGDEETVFLKICIATFRWHKAIILENF